MARNRFNSLIPFLFLAIFAAACGSPTQTGPRRIIEVTASPPALNIGEEGEILFLTEEDFVDPVLYADFQNGVDAEITEQHYSSDQEAIDLIRSFGDLKSYGLVHLSNYAAQVLIEDGLLAELDPNNVPNLKQVAGRFKDAPYDPGNRYCAPIQWAVTGLAYDSTQTSPPEHWGVLFTSTSGSPSFGRISLSDQAREAFGAALLHLGYDINSENEQEIREAADLLHQSRAARVGFLGDQMADMLMSREVSLAQAENRKLSPPLETNQNLAFSVPLEGGILQVDNLCILSTAPPDIKAAAERFINFLLEPEVNMGFATFNFAASPIESAESLLPVGTVGEEFMYPDNLDRVPLHLIQPVGESEQLYQDLFEDLISNP